MHTSMTSLLTILGGLTLLSACSFPHKTGGPCSRSERPVVRTYTETTPADTVAEVFVYYDAGSCAPLPTFGATMSCTEDNPCTVLGPDTDDAQRFRVAVDAPGEYALRIAYTDPVNEGTHTLEHTISFTDPDLLQTATLAAGVKLNEGTRWLYTRDERRFTCRPLERVARFGIESTRAVTAHGCQPELEIAPGQTRLTPDHWSSDIAPALITCAIVEDGEITRIDVMELTERGYANVDDADDAVCHPVDKSL